MAHHPSDTVLFDHVSGALPDAAIVPVSAHLEQCAACRSTQDLLALVGRALISQRPAHQVTHQAAALLSHLNGPLAPTSPTHEAAPVQHYGVTWPQAVEPFKVARRRWITPDIWSAHIRVPSRTGWRVFALGVSAGGAVPSHGHGGREFIHVLKGALKDHRRSAEAGDFLELDIGDVHAMQVVGDESCICLIASEAPLLWRGWVRMLRPWIGI